MVWTILHEHLSENLMLENTNIIVLLKFIYTSILQYAMETM